MSAPPGGNNDEEFVLGPDAARENAGTPFSYSTLEGASQVAKQLVIPQMAHDENPLARDPHEIKSTLDTHLSQYDAHLDRHEAHLEKHLDDHFMASIFNPPHGADLLAAEEDPFKVSDFAALEKAVDADAQRGVKRGAVRFVATCPI